MSLKLIKLPKLKVSFLSTSAILLISSFFLVNAFAEVQLSKGVDFDLTYTGEVNSNLSGGVEHKKILYLGNLDLQINLDLEKMSDWNDTRIFIYFLGNHGNNPSLYAGDTGVSSNIESNYNTFNLYQFWIEHNFSSKFSLLLGLHDLNSEFYVNEPAGLFFNSSLGIGGEFSQTGANGPSIFPTTALSLVMKSNPYKNIWFNLGVYNALAGDPNKPYGTHIVLNSNSGELLVSEIGIKPSETQKYMLGTWMYTKKEDDLQDIDSAGNSIKRINSGVYVLADHKINEYWLFLRYGIANQNVNQVASNLAFGFTIDNLFVKNKDEHFGLAVSILQNGSKYKQVESLKGNNVLNSETSIELTYQVQIMPWLSLQPDFQYILNPGTNINLKDASVFSTRVVLNL